MTSHTLGLILVYAPLVVLFVWSWINYWAYNGKPDYLDSRAESSIFLGVVLIITGLLLLL